MERFTTPLAPVPAWLDPNDEIHNPQPKIFVDRGEFAFWCVESLLALSLPLGRCFELAAHFALETGFGGADKKSGFRGWNLGGVKAYKGWAEAERKAGRRPRYFRAHGNVGTGDSKTVIYMGFDTPSGFFEWWVGRFLPRPVEGKLVRSGRIGDYSATGSAFWAGGDWFRELLAAGYRGSVTRAKPQGSIDAQHQLTETCRTRWAQSKLGVVADGHWGPKSQAACRDFQARAFLPTSGELTAQTVEALAKIDSPKPPQ